MRQRLVLVFYVGVLTMSLLACIYAKTRPVTVSARLLLVDSPRPARFVVEIADTAENRAKGLMSRTSLPPDHGMLFIFDHKSRHQFWMKNTYIALDLIFFDDDFRVVGFRENARPFSLDLVGINQDSRYVLEVNAFTIKKYGIDLNSKAKLVYE